MSENFKTRLYHHEETPPEGVWESIANELDKGQKLVYMNVSPPARKSFSSPVLVAASVILIIVASIFYFTNNNDGTGPKDPLATETIENSRYITLTSLNGDKVRVSSKFSNYIGSLNQSNPEDPAWSQKFTEWRNIMQNKALTPTTANFLDIVELTDLLEESN